MSGDGRTLEERIDALERRLEAIEKRSARKAVAARAVEQEEQSATTVLAEEPAVQESSLVSTVSLIGRTLIVLGGAFLIRFVTEAQMLPQFAGTILGIGYALAWVLLAGRAARKNAYESATFHGVSAALIGFPLLWETTLKLEYLTPVESAAAVSVFAGIPLAVAWRRDMRGFAMVIGAPAAITMLALGFATGTLPPFLGALLLLGFATLILAYDRQWTVLAAFVAFVADFGVLLATVTRLASPAARVVAGLDLVSLTLPQGALAAVYFGTFSFLVFRRRRNLSRVEAAQAVAVLLVALGGFTAAAVSVPAAGTALGLLVLALAVACYAGGYGVLRRDARRKLTYIVYSGAAAAAALVSAYLACPGPVAAVALALGALTCSLIGSRIKSISLGIHGDVYILAAAFSSGLLSGTMLVLSGADLFPALWRQPSAWIVFGVALVVMLLQPAREEVPFQRTRLPATMLATLTLAALVVSASFASTAEMGEAELTQASILRTAVIALAAVLLAWLSRRERFAQAKWLVTPFLLAAGLKLLAQDIPAGKPSILFGSLALFGAALILAPRFLRSRR